jgi:2-oxo-4-hydroxy-4-carboxy-5-ureidoimidazoline decarboxylase
MVPVDAGGGLGDGPGMAEMKITLAAVNALDQATFTDRFGQVFEHSPWIARGAWQARPFASLDALQAAMMAVLAAAGPDAGVALLREHPELAKPANLTAASASEQAAAGLDRLAGDRVAEFMELNRAYRDRFGFPFIIAVRGQRDPDAIQAELRRRLTQSPESEHAAALREVARIARFRLENIVDG